MKPEIDNAGHIFQELFFFLLVLIFVKKKLKGIFKFFFQEWPLFVWRLRPGEGFDFKIGFRDGEIGL